MKSKKKKVIKRKVLENEEVGFWNIPNMVCIFRTVVLIPISILALYFGGASERILAGFVILVAFFLDAVDGYLARTLKQKTVFGSLVDVIADRITEYMLWIFYMGIGLIPIWAPLIVIPRGVITDAIRAEANAKGIAVYKMPRSKISQFLVAGRIPRALIGLCKALLFSGLAFFMAGVIGGEWVPWLVVATVALNLARGIPVIMDAKYVFAKAKTKIKET